MFLSLRQNSLIFILHKGDKPYIETGYVSSVSPAKPKYGLPLVFGLLLDMIVDIIAKVNGVIVNYNSLPANLDIADTFSGTELIMITDNKEAMNAEVLALKLKSIDIINSVKQHKSLITYYEDILNSINPEYAEKLLLLTEINILKTQMLDVSSTLSTLTLLVKELKEDKK